MTVTSPEEDRRRASAPDRLAIETRGSARIGRGPRAMPPQPILFVHHANDMYGADIGLLHSIKSLDRQKYFPIVILPSDMPTGMLSPELDRLGVEYHFAHLGILRRKYLSARK